MCSQNSLSTSGGLVKWKMGGRGEGGVVKFYTLRGGGRGGGAKGNGNLHAYSKLDSTF